MKLRGVAHIYARIAHVLELLQNSGSDAFAPCEDSFIKPVQRNVPLKGSGVGRVPLEGTRLRYDAFHAEGPAASRRLSRGARLRYDALFLSA